MATKWQQAVKEQWEGPKPEAPPAVKPGRCECGCGRFGLELRNRILIRTCHDCKAEEEFE